MESPRKFNDCYFYYYSTCTKGDNCVFRHEPSALGCETMCTAWQQGKCLDKRCKLRHMELRKNRKQIPCYWENQPCGCRKIHCPFMHKNPDARTDGIAPSQPAPPQQQQVGGIVPAGEAVDALPAPMPAPQPVPLLWQQQRQAVVLDSAILGVLPASTDLLAGRRVMPPHEAGGPYAQLPVDPLVVNFEEESDNESAPSSTPTKAGSVDEANKNARTKSQELLLLEKIQAEAAAFYSYEMPLVENKERKIVRTNLNNKYDRLSLDELAGKTQTASESRTSLDFKVLSLDEIRARKKTETIIHSKPITLNLNRKRKLSTQETMTTSGNKIIKVVRSNSIVYKKVDHNQPQSKKEEPKPSETRERKRTLSEQQTDIYADLQENELVDNCYEFKRIKLVENTSKPKLVRNRLSSSQSVDDTKHDEIDKMDNDSDSEVQIVGVEIDEINEILSDNDSNSDIIETTRLDEPVDVVDLSDDSDEVPHLELDKNVPDVVASCHKPVVESDCVISEIDDLLNDDL